MSTEKGSCGAALFPDSIVARECRSLSAISVFFGSFPLLNGPGHRALPDDQALKHQAGSKLGSFQETGSSRSGFDLAELSCGP